MYSVDTSEVQLILGYTDVFKDVMPDLRSEISKLNMHKSISIVCELIRVRDAMTDPIKVFGGEFQMPFEAVLKREMCGIVPTSTEGFFFNHFIEERCTYYFITNVAYIA